MMLSAIVNNILSYIWALFAFVSYSHAPSSNRDVDLSLKDDGLGLDEHTKVSLFRIRGWMMVSFITGYYESVKIRIAPIVFYLRSPSSCEVAGISCDWVDVERADQAPPNPTEEQSTARVGYFYPASTREITETPSEDVNMEQDKQVIINQQDTRPTEADTIPISIDIAPMVPSRATQDTDRVKSSSLTSKPDLLPLNPPLVRSSLSRLVYPESQDTPLSAVSSMAMDSQPDATDPRPRRPRSAAFRPPVLTMVPELRAHALAVLERTRLAVSMDHSSASPEETHDEDDLSATTHFSVSFPAEDLLEMTGALGEDISTETTAPAPITPEDNQGTIEIDNSSFESVGTESLDLSDLGDDLVSAEEDSDDYDIRRWLAHASETSIDGVTHILGSNSDDDCNDEDNDNDSTDDHPASDSGRQMSSFRFLSSSAYLPSLHADDTMDRDHLRSIHSTYQVTSEDDDADDERDDIDDASEYSESDAMERGNLTEATSAHPSLHSNNEIYDDEDSGPQMTPLSVGSPPSSDLDMGGVPGCDDLASVYPAPHPTLRELPSFSLCAQGDIDNDDEWDHSALSPNPDYAAGPPSSPTGSCSSCSSGSSAPSVSPPSTPTLTQSALPCFPDQLPDFATSPRASLGSRLSAACRSSQTTLPHMMPSPVEVSKPRDILTRFSSRLSSIRWADFIPDDGSDDEDGDEADEWVPPTHEWPFNEPESVRPQTEIFIIGDCSDEE